MCIGVPMRVIERRGDGTALCARQGRLESIDTRLVPEPREGDWLLVFLGAARRVLSAEEARLIDEALAGVEAAMRGEQADTFADLTAREPRLPEHMETARRNGARTA